MAKFNQKAVTAKKQAGFMSPSGVEVPTHEGGKGFKQDARSELFRLAVTSLGDDTFYEKGGARDSRFTSLVKQVALNDPEWITKFAPFLRGYEKNGEMVGMQMRRSSVVLGAEYIKALEGVDRKSLPAHVMPRQVISSTMQRADEPAEALAYWLTNYGRNLPMPLKRGIADAATRLYTQRSALKYNGSGKAISMGDVVELTHPSPKNSEQERLFKYLAYKHETVPLDGLDMIRRRKELEAVPMEERRALLGTDALEGAGVTWEWISGWVPGMDAKVWESVIPQMGYMALLRNLRNFEEKGVSKEVLDYVAKKLADPAQVKMSRQFPFRFLSAYKELSGTRFIHALEEAINASVQNIPILKGRTLILQDTSGSMQGYVSAKSKMTLEELGAIFGAVLTQRCGIGNVDWVLYANNHENLTNQADYKRTSGSVLRTMDVVRNHNSRVGSGTETFKALKENYAGHDRVFIITDMQAFQYGGYYSYGNRYQDTGAFNQLLDSIKVPMYTFDVAGYEAAHIEDSSGRYTLAGLTDNTFKAVPLLEAGKTMDWDQLFNGE
jgi:hypothetical protein